MKKTSDCTANYEMNSTIKNHGRDQSKYDKSLIPK